VIFRRRIGFIDVAEMYNVNVKKVTEEEECD